MVGGDARPRRRLRADAEANLDRVIDAAEAVFAEHGLEVSIEVVARRAGVGLGTIYRRFANKDALIAELVTRLLSDVVAIAEQHLNDPGGAGLVNYLEEVGELLATNRGCLARLWSVPETEDLVARSRRLQGELLDHAKSHGVVRDDLTKEDVAVALWSVHGVLDVTRGHREQAWRRHLQLLIAGLTAHGATVTAPPLTAAQMTRIIRESPPKGSPHRAAREPRTPTPLSRGKPDPDVAGGQQE